MVTVVVTCHDNAAHIGAAIASVLAQTLDAHEVVVVDDGSRDDSAARIAAFPGVRLIRQTNRGAAAARNTGVAAATGALIAFLDGDDVWPADSLAQRQAAMARTGVDLVYGAVRQCVGEAGPDAPTAGAAIAGRLAGAMLIRRAVFDRVGGFDTRLTTAETIDWVARADAAGVTSAVCDAVVLYRRIHGNNLMRRTATPDLDCLGVLRDVVRRRRAA